jgi:nucleoside-diphosphate-sugar epimerase
VLASTSLTLVLGATGKTGSRVANRLLSCGLPVRTAVRSGADAHFDWDDPGTYAPALHGARPNGDVKKATGAAPASFADFARRTSGAWAAAEAR